MNSFSCRNPLARPARHLLAGILALVVLGGHTAGWAAEPPRVYRAAVAPHWFAQGTRFWYRNDLKDGAREFVVVDAERGVRSPAFDHGRLAEVLTKQTGRETKAATLPVESLEFDDDDKQVTLRGSTNSWRLDLTTYAVASIPSEAGSEPSLPFDLRIRPSSRTGRETSITFVNRLDGEVELFWIDADGGRRSYGVIARGGTHRQHTFSGHVWIVSRRPAGEVAAVFEAIDSPATAVVVERRISTPRGSSESVPSPDGKWVAFVRDHNVWLRDTATGKSAPLSVDGSAGNTFHKDTSRKRLIGLGYEEREAPASLPEVFWSPDSTKLVALQTRVVPERHVHLIESSPADQLQPKLRSYPYLKPGDEIPSQTPRLFDVGTRGEIPIDRGLFPNPWEIGSIRWSADGARFTFVDNERGHQTLRVIAVRATDGATTILADERSDTFIHYSGKFLLEWLGDDAFLWMSERDGWNHLWHYDAKTGEVIRQLTKGDWNVRDLIRVDRDRGEVWFRAVGVVKGQDPYHVHVCRVNLDGTGFLVLTDGDGTHTVNWSPDHSTFLDTWSRVDLPPVTALRSSRSGNLLCELETADAGEVMEARGRFPERFTAKGRDGETDIWGVIHRPKDFDPAKRYAVVENIYAGPHGQHVPKAFRPEYRHQQEIADRGFLVVQIDGMGTAWRSKAFHDVCWKNLRDAGFPDRIAWIKAAAAKHPEFDLARVGIYGGSAGGQNAMGALLWQHDFYKAAVADCGCHDNRMDKIWWNEQWLGWPVGRQYEENSNVVNAQRLQGALMLVVGELDRNVDPASTLQTAAALVKADKDFDLVVVPGAGHGACETPWGSRRRAEFLIRHLGGPR